MTDTNDAIDDPLETAYDNVQRLVMKHCFHPNSLEFGLSKLETLARDSAIDTSEKAVLMLWLDLHRDYAGLNRLKLQSVLNSREKSYLLDFAICVYDGSNKTHVTTFCKLVKDNKEYKCWLDESSSGFIANEFPIIDKGMLDSISEEYHDLIKSVDIPQIDSELEQYERSPSEDHVESSSNHISHRIDKGDDYYKRNLKNLVGIKDQLFRMTYLAERNRGNEKDLIKEHDRIVGLFYVTDEELQPPHLPPLPPIEFPDNKYDVMETACNRINEILKPYIRVNNSDLPSEFQIRPGQQLMGDDLKFFIDGYPIHHFDDIYDITFSYINYYRPAEGKKEKTVQFPLRSILLGECDRLKRTTLFQSLNITRLKRVKPAPDSLKWQSAYNTDIINRRREIADKVESKLLSDFTKSVEKLKASDDFIANYQAYCYGKLFKSMTKGNLRNAFKPLGNLNRVDNIDKLHIRETFALAWLSGIFEPKLMRLNVDLYVPDLIVIGTDKTMVGVSMITNHCEVIKHSPQDKSVSDWLCGAPEWVKKHFSKYDQDIIRDINNAYILMQPVDAHTYNKNMYTHLFELSVNKTRRELNSAVFSTSEEKVAYDNQIGKAVLNLVSTIASIASFVTPGLFGTLVGLATGLAASIAQIILDEKLASKTDEGKTYLKASENAALGRYLIGLNTIDLFDIAGVVRKGGFNRIKAVRKHFLNIPSRNPLIVAHRMRSSPTKHKLEHLPMRVYRSDLRSPDEVFKTGMPISGTDDDIYRHVNGSSCKKGESAFLATSENIEFLKSHWAKDGLLMSNQDFIYIYEIIPGENYFNAYQSLIYASKKNKDGALKSTAERLKHQGEWLAKGGVSTENIFSAQVYGRSNEGDNIVFIKKVENSLVTATPSANAYPYKYVSHKSGDGMNTIGSISDALVTPNNIEKGNIKEIFESSRVLAIEDCQRARSVINNHRAKDDVEKIISAFFDTDRFGSEVTLGKFSEYVEKIESGLARLNYNKHVIYEDVVTITQPNPSAVLTTLQDKFPLIMGDYPHDIIVMHASYKQMYNIKKAYTPEEGKKYFAMLLKHEVSHGMVDSWDYGYHFRIPKDEIPNLQDGDIPLDVSAIAFIKKKRDPSLYQEQSIIESMGPHFSRLKSRIDTFSKIDPALHNADSLALAIEYLSQYHTNPSLALSNAYKLTRASASQDIVEVMEDGVVNKLRVARSVDNEINYIITNVVFIDNKTGNVLYTLESVAN